jgi:hypothetical protein
MFGAFLEEINITKFMEHNPACESDGCLAAQEFPRLLDNRKVH